MQRKNVILEGWGVSHVESMDVKMLLFCSFFFVALLQKLSERPKHNKITTKKTVCVNNELIERGQKVIMN